MGTVTRIRDNLINFVTGLGTMKDPTTASRHNLVLMDRLELDTAYRSNWLAKRIVNAPAEDATREWRLWQAKNSQIEALEEAETTLDLQRKIRQTLMRARLYGGAALVLGVEQGNADEPLEIEKIKKGDLKFVVSVNRYDLAAGPINWDVMSPWYARPLYYTVTTRLENLDNSNNITITQIHPSRVIPIVGHEIPDPLLSPHGPEWGDSVLIDCDEIIKDFGLTIGGIANMVNDAKMDVVKIPDFSKNIATNEYASRLMARFSFANQSKSTINSLLLDSEEEWQRIQTSFAGLPDLLHQFLTVTSGAAGIPVSRLMGQAPGKALGNGTSGGEQDMKNYYDTISSLQRTVVGPAIAPLDKILQAHALGKIDPTIFYEWAPLYQPDPNQIADIALKKAQTAAQDVSMGLINPDALRRARVNQLIEDGTYPGLEDAVDEFGEEPPEPPADPNYDPSQSPTTPPGAGGGGKKGGGGDSGGGGQTLNITHTIAAQDYDPDQPRAGKGDPKGGQWVKAKGGASSVSFVSPNVEEGLDIDEASKGMQSLREKKLIEISGQIDEALGLKSKSTPVLGAWADGAEHSVMTEYRSPDFQTVVAAAAMKAYLADQKAVLVFQKNPKGSGFLYKFPAKGTLDRVNKDLVEDGVAFHTLVPHADGKGADVLVYDGDGSALEATAKGAARYGSQIEYTRGEGQFLGVEGDGSRADARAAYTAAVEGTGSEGIQRVWQQFGPASGKELLKFEGLTDGEKALSVTSILDSAYPAEKARSKSVEDIADKLNVRAQAALTAMGVKGGKITESTPKTDEMLARVMASEVEAAYSKGGRTSSGWYSDKVEKAMKIAALTHNEVDKDPNARMAYTAALAITSQGEVVPSNVRLTEQAYQVFKDTGKFPTNIQSKNQDAMNNNFDKINKLIEAKGLDGAREFLSQEFTVRDLEKLGYKISGENKDTKVYGSAIFGAKIGQGFYQNLNGNFNPMTFDLWWMRGWGRLTGTLVGKEGDTLVKQKDRFVSALKDAGMAVPKTSKGVEQLAKDTFLAHEIDFSKNRHLYDNGEKSKSELTLAAERYLVGKSGINEQPTSGGQREWMRTVGAKALELLKTRGIDMTPADLQATWWYPEKDLYSKLGGRDSEGINVDYAGALANVARGRGISEDKIRRIMG